jgi:hypothetical protein
MRTHLKQYEDTYIAVWDTFIATVSSIALPLKLLVPEALSYWYMRPQATSALSY